MNVTQIESTNRKELVKRSDQSHEDSESDQVSREVRYEINSRMKSIHF